MDRYENVQVVTDDAELTAYLAEHHATPWDDEGATVRLGRAFYTAEILHDDWCSLDDVAEDYGALVPVARGGHPTRPDQMDGNAEIVGFGQGYDRYWWQPPEWCPSRQDREGFRAFRGAMVNLVEEGYYIVRVSGGVEVDEQGRAITVESFGLGRVEPDYITEAMADVVGEVYSLMDRWTRQMVLCDPWTGELVEA